ncbi:MAG: hypothetical protein R3Y32_05075 [Bacillota bacterium]
MIILITMLIVFVILVIEIPFSIFLNFSIDRVLLEYMLLSPIKTNGYAYIKNGELFHGGKRGKGEGGINTLELAKFINARIIIKALHIRGIFGDEEIEKSILQSVAFSALASQVLQIASMNNQFAKLSQSYQMESGEDDNIFVQSTAWLSVLDLLFITVWVLYKSLARKITKE